MKNLAHSLTAETAELVPFLPYLLQDFWELGSEPDIMAELIEKHIPLTENTRILDLACGKGAVSVKIAKKLRIKVKGIDLMPDFIDFAKQKAKEFGVADLCEFAVGDINQAVNSETDCDCVILGAVGDVLGPPADTLAKLKQTIKPGGFILIDDGYISDETSRENVKWSGDSYLTKAQWLTMFEDAGLKLTDTSYDDNGNSGDNPDSKTGMAAITARANELIEKHPDKREIFEGYIRTQQDEYSDIDSSVECVTWILQKEW